MVADLLVLALVADCFGVLAGRFGQREGVLVARETGQLQLEMGESQR